MKARTWLSLVTPCFCAVLAHYAWAQQASGIEEAASQPSPGPAVEAAPSYTGGSEEHRYYDRHQWIANLQKAGIVNRALPGPYRVAMPLMSFGDAGPKIMLTYAKNMPGNTGGQGLLLFITVGIP
ncbi:MAG TPA: hypothetical protein VJ752_23275 [Burkholderiaceae bacterium]|nr:hypothetical protein [Burkholderiaceae bacterium]